MEEKKQTVKEWLEELAKSNQSTDKDSLRMENCLKVIGFPSARVLLGIVYPEGSGQPVSIHSMARMLLDIGGGK
jgi:hypothetical protein